MNYARLLEGKNALISDGASPVGRAIAVLFARHGARVAFGAKDAASGEATLSSLAPISPDSFYALSDADDAQSVERFLAEAKARMGSIDVLVNLPARPCGKSLLETGEDDDAAMLTANQHSVLASMRAMLKERDPDAPGAIVNVTSNVVFRPVQGDPLYAMSMGASGGLTRVGAVEAGRVNVRVNELQIAPDADPDAAADAALFLASDMSAYVTAATLVADGGARRRMAACEEASAI